MKVTIKYGRVDLISQPSVTVAAYQSYVPDSNKRILMIQIVNVTSSADRGNENYIIFFLSVALDFCEMQK